MPKTKQPKKAITQTANEKVRSRTQATKKTQPKKQDRLGAAAKKTAQPIKTSAAAEPTVARSASGQRLLQTPERIWYKPLTWRNRPPTPDYKPLPKARKLLWRVLQQLWANKMLFGGIVLTYGVLSVLFVRGFSDASNFPSVKRSLDSALQSGTSSRVAETAVSLVYLFSTSGSGSTANAGVYQVVLFILCSLAFIWALRRVLAGQPKQRVRDSFYKGMYPVIPFMLLLLLAILQLLPFAATGGLYSIVSGNDIAVHWWETMCWLGLLAAGAFWSLRMLTATIFALYIVTLPDVAPLQAYRSARQLIYGRRLMLWRKLIFLPFVLLVLAAIIETPLILFLTPVATWAFFLFGMVALPVIHGYLYNLYRDML